MSKSGMKPLLSLMMAVILIFTVLPVFPAQAATAGTLKITNLSDKPGSPTSSATGKIDIIGTYQDVNVSSITYVIESIVGSTVVGSSSGGDMQPDTSDGKTFKFYQVSVKSGTSRVTVKGTTTSGQEVTSVGYVSFIDAPNISSVKVGSDSTQEGVPYVVSSETPSITVEAPNAVTVTLNGNPMFSGGAGIFFSTPTLSQGSNTLTFVASSATSTYAETRTLVYYNNNAQMYNVKIGSTAIDPDSTISTKPSGAITGQVVVAVPASGTSADSLDAQISLSQSADNSSVKVGAFNELPIKLTNKKTISSSLVSYSFTTGSKSVPTLASGAYALDLFVVDTNQYAASVKFKVRGQDDNYIKNIYQLYGTQFDDTAKTLSAYSSKTPFEVGAATYVSVPELPLWLAVEVGGTNGGDVTIKSDDAAIPAIASYTDKSGTSYKIFQISKLKSGEQTLTFAYGTDSVSVPINYQSAPYIQVTNLYNEQVFTASTAVKSVQGRLINFTDDSSVIKIEYGGRTTTVTSSNGVFQLDVADFALDLAPGANTLKLSGTANGKAVTTSLTLYLIEDESILIENFHPLPVGSDKTDNSVFVPGDNADQYTTNELSMDAEFTITPADTADEIIVRLDGNKKETRLTRSGAAWSQATGELKLGPKANTTNGFLLQDLALPTTGDLKVTVYVRKGTSTTSKTLTVTRELRPYTILSPKLPNESVITQNFLDVSIQSEGASSITVGKQVLDKGDLDIFRGRLTALKAGKNTIKFTIVTGSKKTTGSFVVNYSQEIVQGSQYSAAMPSGGSLKLFKGDLQIKIPKGTVLREVNPTPGSESPTISLFDNQQLLVGIANQQDGRTIKMYNQVGVSDGQGGYRDGQLKLLDSNGTMISRLTPKPHFGYASDLYWTDAGYFTSTATSDDYKTVPGNQPYASPGFESRSSKQWLELTQTGTITIKYDPSLVNASAGNLGIWRLNGNEWVNLGGTVNKSAKTITAPFDGFGYYAVFGLRYSYGDVIAAAATREDTEMMLSRGVMKAKDANEFGVNEVITRGEFATMLVRMLNIPLDYDEDITKRTFDDVGPVINQYMDYRYIETAVRKGIIRGTGPRVFMPYNTLSREDATVMIARAMNLKLTDNDKAETALEKSFTDGGSINSSYAGAVLAVTKAKIINGKANKLAEGEKKATYRFDPKATFTRAEAADIAVAIMTKMKTL
ncbi:S-layer homology domain-containing protein [Saccharibacillus sp. CPCC 101409]|uniref:S-layer homology domain-containing protein n=1 Tax=Saccharibacillus sp. CPCC 101409 TaxID=3058041 RepID=UPI0026713A2D|nr:S-layer homology domain-containing protein [Saccharibacillus sp. CPCC 101409]MDO3412098.1 S-layer homology domain-containing protein [Saccharibacillus sp. CPCC 101409]